MVMCARQIVFVYDGDAKSNELVPDTDGKAIIPERGEIIERNGKRILNPESTTIFEEGDVVWIVGEKKLIVAITEQELPRK